MGGLVDLLVFLVAILLVVTLVVSAMTLAAAALVWRRLRRRLRLVAVTRSPAPTAWLVSPSQRARLHRRLRAATGSAQAAGVLGGEHLRPLVADVEAQAQRIERSLVRLPTQGRAARSAARALDGEIGQLEGVVHQLSSLSLNRLPAHRLSRPPIDALRERIDTLAQAHADLDALERLQT